MMGERVGWCGWMAGGGWCGGGAEDKDEQWVC
jgi:hypothetical protein